MVKLLDINSATFDELLVIDGINESIAQNIIAYKSLRGSFEKLEDLTSVNGISASLFLKIAFYLTITKAKIVNVDDVAVKRLFKLSEVYKQRGKRTTGQVKYIVTKEPAGLPVDGNDNLLNEENLQQIAMEFSIELPCLKAVVEVEACGKGMLESGKPKLRFEGHDFWQHLLSNKIDPEQFSDKYFDLVYPNWSKKYYVGGEAEYTRLLRAQRIHSEAALLASVWGKFEMPGSLYSQAGFKNINSFVKAMYSGEAAQLKAFISYLRSINLLSLLQNKEWAEFAFKFKGMLYKSVRYDAQLAMAYNRAKKIA